MFYYNFLHISTFLGFYLDSRLLRRKCNDLGFKYDNMICAFVIYTKM